LINTGIYPNILAMALTPKSAFEHMPCHATALRKAARRVTQMYEGALAETGLRSTQLAILLELTNRADKPPTMAELAESLVIERSALGHTLRPLERDGLITLQEGEDRRQRYVVLTTKGKAKFKEGANAWRIAQERFEEIFGRTDARALRQTLLGLAYDDRFGKLKD
jgi:DNA-binding MarR family transcriptional regulator